ncbi:enoyl-CoA hydratase/isomerase family protein [Sporosarcina sp. FA9]|uniref:enoyl-CoA hydratase/isomerase family protein n=1 Tax=Sporosarcina sp. FA9 TaxID=3413030 RepID=UPI003F65B2F6
MSKNTELSTVEKKALLITEFVDEVAILKINRPEKLNALNTEMIEALKVELKRLEDNEKVKGIILTGVEKSFIVGADISEMKNLSTESSIKFISNLHELINTIRNLNKPVIAAVNGYCFGAGLELAISCDLTICSKEASFGMQEVKIGIPSVIEAALFPFIIGLNKTRELLLTGDVIDSKTAIEIGLVNHVVEHSELMEKTMEYTLKITVNPSYSVMLQKQLINRWLDNAGLNQSIQNGVDYFGRAFSHPDTNKIMGDALK